MPSPSAPARLAWSVSLCIAALSSLCLSLVRAAEPFRTDHHPEPAEPQSGWFWGSVDANVDWCERNYATTQYCAEFYNALSSLPIAGFALFGLIMGRRHARADTRISFAFGLMVLVGLGSFMFHATLRRYAQAMDELPMLYGSIALLYNAIDHNVSAEDRAAIANGDPPAPLCSQIRYRFALKFSLVSAAVILTTIYFHFPQFFAIFFLGYGSALMAFVLLMAYHIFCGPRSARRSETLQATPWGYEAAYGFVPAGSDPHGDGDADGAAGLHGISINSGNGNGHSAGSGIAAASAPQSRPYTPLLSKLYLLGIAGYFGGFVFWLLENFNCTALPEWMQLHALWHVMAGVGTFSVVQCQLAWRVEESGGRAIIDTDLGGKVLPVVVAKWNGRNSQWE